MNCCSLHFFVVYPCKAKKKQVQFTSSSTSCSCLSSLCTKQRTMSLWSCGSIWFIPLLPKSQRTGTWWMAILASSVDTWGQGDRELFTQPSVRYKSLLGAYNRVTSFSPLVLQIHEEVKGRWVYAMQGQALKWLNSYLWMRRPHISLKFSSVELKNYKKAKQQQK